MGALSVDSFCKASLFLVSVVVIVVEICSLQLEVTCTVVYLYWDVLSLNTQFFSASVVENSRRVVRDLYDFI